MYQCIRCICGVCIGLEAGAVEWGEESRVFRGVLVGFVFEKLLKIFTVEVAFSLAFNLTICR